MNLPEQYHKIILDEFKETLIHCNEVVSLEDKLYFFSASFGIVNRVMNLHCDPLLIFIHQILSSTHQGFIQRLSLRSTPGIVSQGIPAVEKLFSYFSELISAFENKDEIEIRKVLEKFSNLWYATSGNGFYLFLTDKIKL
jgi:hypothetical protein